MEQIGLEGVFKTQQFADGLAKYTAGLARAMDSTTFAEGSLSNAAGSIIKVGLVTLGALAGAVTIAGGAFVNTLMNIAVEEGMVAKALDILSAKTGLSTTALQEWSYAGQFLGITADDVGNYFFRVSRSAYAASLGTKASVEAFKSLGVNIYDTKGKLKDTNTLFLQSIDALGKIKDPTVQDALAMAIFGRSAQDLFPLIKAGSAELENLAKVSHNVGAIISEEDIAAFSQYDDTLKIIRSSVSGLTRTFIAQFLPTLQDVTGGLVDVLTKVNAGDYAGAFKKIGLIGYNLSISLTRGMRQLTASFPNMTKLFKMGIKTIGSLIGNAPMLINAGKDLMQAIIDGAVSLWPDLKKLGVDTFNTIYTALTGKKFSMGGILDAILTGGVDLSNKFKTWVASVNWAQLSRDVSNAINGVPWTGVGQGIGGAIGTIGKNIYDAFHDIIFGKTTTTWNMTTSSAETSTIGGIDWGAIGTACVNAFRNGITSALGTGGLGLGDVSTFKGLQAEWIGIGQQYGEVAGKGMAPTFWKTLWDTLTANISWPTVWNILLTPDKIAFQISVDVWTALGNEMKRELNLLGLGIQFDVVTINQVADNFAKSIGDAFSTGWTNVGLRFGIDMTNFLNKATVDIQNMGIQIANALAKIVGGPQQQLNPYLPNIPYGPTTGTGTGATVPTAPTVPVPGVGGIGTTPMAMGAGSNKTVTNNITVNNPSAEPASNSVDSTLRKLSYLGVA